MKVLIVDDSRSMRMILRKMMTKMGFDDIREAEHGVAALESLATSVPELALVEPVATDHRGGTLGHSVVDLGLDLRDGRLVHKRADADTVGEPVAGPHRPDALGHRRDEGISV